MSSPPPGGEEGDDVTKVGSFEGLRSLSLPRLQNDNDGDEVSNDSTAMTLYEDGAEVDEPTAALDLIVLSAAAHSDVGNRRRRNEDSYLLDDERSLFVVADGMGGYAGGDVASQLATKTISSYLADGGKVIESAKKRPREGTLLVAAIEAANSAIYEKAQLNPEFHGMGTTVVAVSFTKRKRRGYIAYAGDSRCYRLRGEDLKLLTEDHTFAARGVRGPLGDQIRRAVGVRPTIKVDLIVDSPHADDVYLLCSDGLNKMIPDEKMRTTLVEQRADLSSCARSLVQQANDAGGRDNITVLVVSVREARPREVKAALGATA